MADIDAGRAVVDVEAEVDQRSLQAVAKEINDSLGGIDTQRYGKSAGDEFTQGIMASFSDADPEIQAAIRRSLQKSIEKTRKDAIEKPLQEAIRRGLEGGDAETVGSNTGRKFSNGFTRSIRRAFRSGDGDRSSEGIVRRLLLAAPRAGASFATAFSRALQGGIVSNPYVAVGLVSALVAAAPIAGAAVSSAFTLAFGGGLAGIGIAFAAQADRVQSAWSKVGSNIGAQMRDISSPFEDTLVHIADVAQDTFDNLAPALEESFARMAPAVSDFADNLGKAFGEGDFIRRMTDAFIPLLDVLGERMPEILGNIADGFADMAESIDPDFFGDFMVVLSEIIGGLFRFFGWLTKIAQSEGFRKFLSELGDALGGLIDAFGEWYDAIWPIVRVFYRIIGAGIIGFIKLLEIGVRNAAAAVEYLVDAFGWLKDRWEDIKGFFGDVKDFLGIGEWAEGIQALIDPTYNAGVAAKEALKEGFLASKGITEEELKQSLLGSNKSLEDVLANKVQLEIAGNAARRAFTNGYQANGGMFGALRRSLTQTDDVGRTAGRTMAKGFLDASRKQMQAAMKSVAGLIAPGILRASGKAGTDAGAALIRSFRAEGARMRETARTVAEMVTTAFARMNDVGARAGTALVNGFRNAAVRLMRQAARAVADMVGQAFAQMRETGARAAASLSEGFRSTGVDRVQSAANAIASAIDLSGMYDVGAAAGRALAAGLRAAGLAAARSAAQAIAGVIAASFPGSPVKEGPLRVLNQGRSGREIVNMLAGGMLAQSGELRRAAGIVAAHANIPASGTAGTYSTASGGSAATLGGTVVNQNFYGPTTGGDRLRELTWTLRYATGYRGPQSFEGVR